MSGIKYYERTRLLIEMIEKRKTGRPEDLARKFQVHKRTLYRILEDIRGSTMLELVFSKEFGSYIFRKKI
jgi:DeoR/GlpR family transcriptional regulator of sugar metabolism